MGSLSVFPGMRDEERTFQNKALSVGLRSVGPDTCDVLLHIVVVFFRGLETKLLPRSILMQRICLALLIVLSLTVSAAAEFADYVYVGPSKVDTGAGALPPKGEILRSRMQPSAGRAGWSPHICPRHVRRVVGAPGRQGKHGWGPASA